MKTIRGQGWQTRTREHTTLYNVRGRRYLLFLTPAVRTEHEKSVIEHRRGRTAPRHLSDPHCIPLLPTTLVLLRDAPRMLQPARISRTSVSLRPLSIVCFSRL